MKAIVWKDLRENLVWAAVALTGLGIALSYALSSAAARYGFNYGYGNEPGLCSSTFNMATTTATALWGGALGLLQFLPELARDRWAFLIHRPLSRSTIFSGKVLGGLPLYFIAAGLPFFVAAAWVAWPGHVPAPFDARLMLPGIADILCGVVFYFAGVLTALRPARWYASRALPIPAAIVTAIFVHTLPEFWHALLVIAVAGGVLAVAAWGSFLTGGVYASQRPVSKLALIVVLTAGLATVLGCAAGIAASVFSTSPLQSFSYEQYQITNEGAIVKVKTGMDGYTASVTDLKGKPVAAFTDKYTWQNVVETAAYLSLARDHRLYSFMNYRSSERYFINIRERWAFNENWYYSFTERLLVGYSNETKLPIGSIGPDGFAPGRLGGKRFEGELSADTIMKRYQQLNELAFPDAVYLIEARNHGVRLVFTPPTGQHIDDASSLLDTNQQARLVLVAMGGRLHVLDFAGKELVQLPLLADAEKYSSVAIYAPAKTKQYIVWYSSDYTAKNNSNKLDTIETWSATGERLDSLAVPSYMMQYQEALKKQEDELKLTQTWVDALPGALIPTIAAPATLAIAFLSGNETMRENMRESIQTAGRHEYLGLAFMLLGGIACAVAAAWLGRRYDFARSLLIGWTVFVFLLGIPGLLVFIAIHDWPARVACPGCKRLRVVTRETCEYCAAEFAAPVRDGTEVFD